MTLSTWKSAGQSFRFRGHQIFFQAEGQGRRALLCLHGFPTASWDFEPLWPALRQRFAQVLAPDFLGFGFSDKPRGHAYSLLEQADLCDALLAERGVDELHILAHDYGVSVAQELLARELSAPARRARLASIVFMNGGLFPEAHRPLWVQRLLHSPAGVLVSQLMSERGFNRSFSRIFGEETRPSLIELHDFWSLIAHQGGHRVSHRLIRYLRERRLNRRRWRQAMQQARLPMCFIYGPEDRISGEHMAQRYRALIPQADTIAIPGIGHYPHVEAPDRVLRALDAFYRRAAGA